MQFGRCSLACMGMNLASNGLILMFLRARVFDIAQQTSESNQVNCRQMSLLPPWEATRNHIKGGCRFLVTL